MNVVLDEFNCNFFGDSKDEKKIEKIFRNLIKLIRWNWTKMMNNFKVGSITFFFKNKAYLNQILLAPKISQNKIFFWTVKNS